MTDESQIEKAEVAANPHEIPATVTSGTAVAAPRQKAELVTGHQVSPIIPRTIDEVARIARAVIIAKLAPDSYTKNCTEDEAASKIMIGIMKGAEIGLAPLTAIANIAIINGRPCLWGDGAVGLIQASGKVESWEEIYDGEPDTDGYTAICTIWRKGQSAPYVGRFSLGDAKRAKLLSKGPWIEYRGRMQMWRARSYAMRTGFADCLSGLSIAEEVQDLPPPPAPVNTSFLNDETAVTEDVPKDEAAPQ